MATAVRSAGGRRRFASFEVDPRTGELFRNGRRVRVQQQPLELLLALLEQPGQVVSRDELRQRLWPDQEFGAFDNGLNTAVNKLREALGDSAERPRLLETLPRRGYRFIHRRARAGARRDAVDFVPISRARRRGRWRWPSSPVRSGRWGARRRHCREAGRRRLARRSNRTCVPPSA